MTSFDLHPEELLDRAAQGTLTADERARLDQHLRSCAVCRFEQAARADFRGAAAGERDVEDLVARALAGLPVLAPPARRATAAKSMRVLAAATVLLASMASFAAVATATSLLPRVLQALTGATAQEPPGPGRAARPREDATVRQEPRSPAPQPEPEAAARPPEPAAPEAAPAPLAAPREVVTPAPRARPAVRQEEPARVEPALAADDVPDAGALFARANQERVQGHRAEAAKLYVELLQSFPAAPEARVSEATLGRLWLDSGDPAAALVQLDAYLQSGDATLREEVLAARATALSRLNRPRDEAAAWATFLQGYPDSIHAPRARARLAELEGR